jgi:VCBS repeat-containing protein
MAISITFDGAPTTGFIQSYVESGFTVTSQQATTLGLTDVLWSGLSKVNEGTGNYLINEYSQDSIVVKYTGATNSFGALSLDVDGYKNGLFDATGHILPATAQVTFNFTGVHADSTEVHFSFTTDNVTGWEHITLPSSFATGLVALTWTTNASSEAWGAFDNVNLVLDSTSPPSSPTNPGGANVAPVAGADAATITVKTSAVINVTANDTDANGDTIGIAGMGPDATHIVAAVSAKSALGADISFQDGEILYNANATSYANLAVGQTATDSFYYTSTDPSGATSSAKVTVTIVNPGHAPTVVADTASVTNHGSVTVNVLANDSDSDSGDTLTLSGFGPNAGGAAAYTTSGLSALGATVSLVSGKIVYNANASVFDSLTAGQTKTDTVYYTVTDSHGLTSTSSLTINVGSSASAPVNHAPTAVNDTATVVNEGKITINVLANDSDADHDTLTLAGFGASASAANSYHLNGTSALGASVSLVDGKLLYSADAHVFDALSASQSKVDTIYYTVTDSNGLSSVASVAITVKGQVQGCDINGTSRSETLNGTSAAEDIHGCSGNDKVNGLDGNDRLYGEDGNDSLSGGGGADSLCGADGNDTLDGGSGNDTYTGGDDNDSFVFGANFGKDVITDFHGGHMSTSSSSDCGTSTGSIFDIFALFGIFFGGSSSSSSSTSSWSGGDVISIAKTEFTDYNDLLAHAKNTSSGVLITTTDGQDSLLIQGTSVSSLDSRDFLFV